MTQRTRSCFCVLCVIVLSVWGGLMQRLFILVTILWTVAIACSLLLAEEAPTSHCHEQALMPARRTRSACDGDLLLA